MIPPNPKMPPLNRNATLFEAALNGDAALLKEMIKQGADVNAKGERFRGATLMPALCAAADAGKTESVRLLVEAGAKLDEGTYEGRTPLICAVREGHVDIAKILLGAGAKLKSVYGGETLVDMAERCPQPLPMLRVLLDAMDDRARNDAVLNAARAGRANTVIAAAMRKGFDVEHADVSGNTALILAAQGEGSAEDSASIVQALLKKGAQVDAVNDFGETALCAAMTRHPVHGETVRLLVQAGADISRRNLSGLTNYESAQLAGNEEIMPLFEAAYRQGVLREVKKYHEGTNGKLTIRKDPLKPKKPSP